MSGRIFLGVVVFVCEFLVGFAQVERVLPRRGGSSLEGTSFVVGFMANEVIQVGVDPRIQIFVSSQYNANVTFRSNLFGSYTVQVAANTVHVERIHPLHVVNASERAFNRAIFVESDAPVVVYALNTLAQSTDSYTAIPTKHLGTRYYTVNRPTDWYRGDNNRPSSLDRIPRVGEFMVIATENNTLVDISTTTATKNGIPARTPWQVWLNKGDCYLVQAAATRFGGDDLTGSSVSSNIPVAVLSGHQRSSVITDSVRSKDHLVEQLPPLDKWGRRYVTTPFALTGAPDVIRIMASTIDQDIFLTTRSGTRSYRLNNPGEWIDVSLAEAAYWDSPDPFFVTQFMASQESPWRPHCDPAMVVVPAVEQFVNAALFQFPELEITNERGQQFFYLVNIIADSVALPTLRVSGRRVLDVAPQMAITKVPGTNLHWTVLQFELGSYMISADTGTFSGVMYGTSTVDSYANMIGVAYEPILQDDRTPPVYTLLVDCGVVSGTISDLNGVQPRLDELKVVPSQTFNYRWQISPPTDTAGSVEFAADIRDLWKDAQIVIHAFDDQGNGREWTFSYDAPNVDVPKQVIVELDGAPESCTTIVLRNRDSTPVHIRGITVAGDRRIRISAGQQLDTIVAAGDSLHVEVCIVPGLDTSAVAGSIVVEYPCKLLHMINVRSQRLSSLSAGRIDFGDVRIGDTACGRVPIVNRGTVSVTITALDVAAATGPFRVDVAGLGLPKVLRAGDTLWVNVCFTPDTTGDVERTDRVRSVPELGAQTVYTGRGIRPRISSVLVDWGRRRVGSINDSTITLANTGNGWAVVDVAGVTAMDSPFAFPGGSVASTRLDPTQTLTVPIRFVPVDRGAFERIVPVGVDWSRHEPVSITLRGEGTMPEIRVDDIDLGVVTIGLVRDTVAVLAQTGATNGNEDLRVYSVRVSGADAPSFTLPASLLNLQSMATRETLTDLVRYAPITVGVHRCTVEIEHDAARSGERALSTFVILGRGVELIVAEVRLDLQVATNVDLCRPFPAVVELSNVGNGPMRIDTFFIEGGGQYTDVRPAGAPFVLAAGGSFRSDTVWVFLDRDADRRIGARAVDSVPLVYTAEVRRDPPIPEATASIRVAGDGTIRVGPGVFDVEASVTAPHDREIVPVIRIEIPKARYLLDVQRALTAEVRGPMGTITTVPVSVEQTDEAIVYRLPALRGPWSVSIRVPGSFLWLDPDPFRVTALVEATSCFDGAVAEPITIAINPCGNTLRVVRLGAGPVLTGRVLEQPARETIQVELKADRDVLVNVECETLGGQRFLVAERFSLQKGVRHCNFSCSGWASGVYRLIFRHDSGVAECQIIIVN